MSGSKTMRVIRQDSLGGPDVLREAEAERPSPRPGEVLIRVRTAGVNPTDWKHRAGGGFLGEPPFVLGWDVCGTVVEAGYGVTIHRTGDEVFGMLPYPFGHGSHAEYVVGPARAFVARPEGVDVVQAGALPLVSLTAWQALVDTAVLGPGQRLLVHAAAGGVGHVAVQIAKSRGAYVVGTASSAKHGFLRSLGADEQIDYRETDFTEAVSGMDVVLETIGGEHGLRSLRVLRPGGTLVSLLPLPRELYAEAERRGVRTAVMLVEDDQAGMRAVADLAATGRLR
ncbi:NADP-dependent oxidoreductase, partial [Streptomyces sp. UH6]|uniref:NADP-dependent oxidoreductase n=1 Tax=Streptomyces sp. UH6 TaxID=2748379 RepID=UPI0015D47053